MDAAIEAHRKALEHSYKMSDLMTLHKNAYLENSLAIGPIYWELYTKFRDAEAAYTAAKEAVLLAEQAIGAAYQEDEIKKTK